MVPKVSRRPLKKKDSPRSPRSSAWSPPSKRCTKNAIAPSLKMWKRPRSSKRAKSRFGNAATADTSWSERRPRKSAPFALTRKPTSKSTKKITKSRTPQKQACLFLWLRRKVMRLRQLLRESLILCETAHRQRCWRCFSQ